MALKRIPDISGIASDYDWLWVWPVSFNHILCIWHHLRLSLKYNRLANRILCLPMRYHLQNAVVYVEEVLVFQAIKVW